MKGRSMEYGSRRDGSAWDVVADEDPSDKALPNRCMRFLRVRMISCQTLPVYVCISGTKVRVLAECVHNKEVDRVWCMCFFTRV